MNNIQLDTLRRVNTFLKSAAASVGDTLNDEIARAPFYGQESIEGTIIRFDADNLRYARNSINDAMKNIEYIIKRHEDLDR
jgi:hypothetical protein